MSKSTKSEATTSTNRESLVAAIDLIRRDREAEEKSFKAALEKLYADHRKAMADLKARREAAWKTYGEAAKKPEAKKSAKKAATKKSAKKAAVKKDVPDTCVAVLPDEFANG